MNGILELFSCLDVKIITLKLKKTIFVVYLIVLSPTDGGDCIIKSSCPLLSLDEDDESRPLYHPNAPNAHITKVPNIVVTFPCLAASVVLAQFH
jgi:hypothetical protein